MDDSILVITLSAGVYEGLLIWLWVVHYVTKYCLGGGRVPTFTLFFLLSDLPELVLTPLMFQKILSVKQTDLWSHSPLVFGIRLHALYLHQLMALESILCFRHPQYSAQFFTPIKSLIICLSVWVSVAFLTHLCATEVPLYVCFSIHVLLFLIPLVMAIVTCVLALTKCPISSQASSAGLERKAAILVIVASIVMLVFVYIPFLVVMCLAHCPSSLSDGHPFYSVPETAWMLTTSAMGFRIMTDPLLCVLVCSQVKKLRSVTTEGGQRPATTERDVSVEVHANLGSD